MSNRISKRAHFLTHPFPDDLIRQERDRRPHHSHSLALLVVDPAFQHLVVARSATAAARDPMCPLVPPQLRLHTNDRLLSAAAQTITSFLQIGSEIHDRVHYLGYSFGTRSGRQSHAKFVHWAGLVVSSEDRRHRFHRLLRSTEQLTDVQWMRFSAWQHLHAGAVTSDAKHRMVMQALLQQAQREQTTSRAVRRAHQQLAAVHPDLLPTPLSSVVAAQ